MDRLKKGEESGIFYYFLKGQITINTGRREHLFIACSPLWHIHRIKWTVKFQVSKPPLHLISCYMIPWYWDLCEWSNYIDRVNVHHLKMSIPPSRMVIGKDMWLAQSIWLHMPQMLPAVCNCIMRKHFPHCWRYINDYPRNNEDIYRYRLMKLVALQGTM